MKEMDFKDFKNFLKNNVYYEETGEFVKTLLIGPFFLPTESDSRRAAFSAFDAQCPPQQQYLLLLL